MGKKRKQLAERRESEKRASLSPPQPPPPTLTPSPPPTPPPTPLSQPSAKSRNSRSRIKLDFSAQLELGAAEIEAEKVRNYVLVDQDCLLQWVNSIARCKCGNKMTVKEGSSEGMTKSYLAKCGQCNIERRMCTSQGGIKKSCASKGMEEEM